ncbi:hypothetical protein NKDENANG_00513 [Candidatus Entotheonellaceae bacterium PAL068K]
MTVAVLYEPEAHIVTMTLKRPEQLNAMNRQLKRELAKAIGRYDQDDTHRTGRDHHRSGPGLPVLVVTSKSCLQNASGMKPAP